MSRKFSNLEVPKQLITITQSHEQNYKIPSEIRNFFTGKRINPAFSKFMTLLEGMRISDKDLGGKKRENCQLTNLQLFQIILILPFMAVPGFLIMPDRQSRNCSGVRRTYSIRLWPRTIQTSNIIWHIACHLIKAVTIRKDYQKSHLPAVLIVDDSDLPKTGLRMECIGKIFSHVFQRCILGYKLLALCWSDGRSQFVVDFSIHGERGKVDGKEQGLTARQRERRYNRKRDRDCQTEKRKEEYFVSKLERLKSMVKRPLEDCSPIYMKAYTSSPSWKRSGQSLLM